MPAAVERLVKPASRSAARQLPREPPRLPHCRVENAGIAGVDREVDAAGVVVDEEHLAPGVSAVGRLEDAALRIRPEDVPHRSRIRDMGVVGINDDLRDHVGIAQTGVRPRLARIARLVHAVAGIEIASNVGFAGSGIDDVRIGGCDRKRADRIRDAGNLTVGNVAPG
jgi:hypothetical protein